MNTEIFISYAWGGDSEQIVDELYKALSGKGYQIIRDKVDLGFKGNIKTFMQDIGKGKYVIVVISDKYLKSPNCMYEIVQIQENQAMYKRIFPIVLGDADIYSPVKRIQYIKHWQEKVDELNQAMKGLSDMSVINEIAQELSEYRSILNSTSSITTMLKNMNTLTPEMHRQAGFQTIMDAIDKQMETDKKEALAENSSASGGTTNHTTHIEGNDNITITDVSGSNININVNKSSSTSNKKRVDTTISDIMDFRKKSILRRLEMQYKLVDEYKNKLILVDDDPKKAMRFEQEIENLTDQIAKTEKELKEL